MNSRLNMALRERSGYSYSAESHYAPYADTGALQIYFSCDKSNFSKCMQITRHELKKLRDKTITDRQLESAKKQVLGQLAISYENNEHLMLTMGKSYLLFDRVDSLDNISHKLSIITAADLLDTARRILDANRFNTLIYK